MRRALAGLVAGAIAGVGLRLTWRPLIPAECATQDGSACAVITVVTLPLFLIIWTLVAGLALYWLLGMRPEAGEVLKVGGALWVLLTVTAWNTGLLAEVEIVLPVVAFLVAAVRLGPVQRRETREP